MKLKLGMKLYPKSHKAVRECLRIVKCDTRLNGKRMFCLQYKSGIPSDKGLGTMWLSEQKVKRYYTDDGQTAIEIKEA